MSHRDDSINVVPELHCLEPHATMRRLRAFLSAIVTMMLMIGISGAMAQTQAPASGEAAAGGETRRLILRFLTDADFPPFNYYDEEGVLTGFNVDLARAICLEAGVACDVQVRPWDELMLALNRGEADAVIAGHTISARLLRSVDFTDRYFHTPARFAGRRGAERIEITPEALDGKKIGVTRNTTHEAYLKAFFRYSAIQAFENADETRDALAAGKVDLIFDDGISLGFWVSGTNSKECCELRGGAFLEPKFFGDGLAIAVPRRDPALKSLLNRALHGVRESGRFEELVLRYFPNRVY
ncbi:transporter substrate-binding domain-containing protein [Leptospira interrogans]